MRSTPSSSVTLRAFLLRTLATASLLAAPAAAVAQAHAPPAVREEVAQARPSPVEADARPRPARTTSDPVRFFFGADAHSRHRLMEGFIEHVLRERPGLVVDGGDLVHDGTESEFRRALSDRARLDTRWYAVRGNHDALPRGPYFEPPPLPAFAVFDYDEIRFVLLDNHDGTIDGAQFQQLETELRAQRGRRVIVVMHVPAVVSRVRPLARLRHVLPFPLAEPVMTDAAQVARFMNLMETYGVLAVLAGHTHAPDEVARGGVRYITAGAIGGLTPGFGIANEYLDIVVSDREVHVRRVPLNRPAGNPVGLLVRAFRFYAELNGFNHDSQGWNYVPSASVQWRTALTRIESGGDETVMLTAAASFERVLGHRGRQAFFSDIGISAGSSEFLPHASAGYRLRPIGTFNRNVFISGALAGNAGLLRGAATAGIGVRAGLGLEWRGVTFEAISDHSTSYRAMSFVAGRRY
jgi:predicted phosphodiesterase